MLQNSDLIERGFGFPNMYWFFLGKAFSMFMSFAVIFQMRGWLRFSGVFSIMMRLSSSRSVHFSLVASPDLIPVSLSS